MGRGIAENRLFSRARREFAGSRCDDHEWHFRVASATGGLTIVYDQLVSLTGSFPERPQPPSCLSSAKPVGGSTTRIPSCRNCCSTGPRPYPFKDLRSSHSTSRWQLISGWMPGSFGPPAQRCSSATSFHPGPIRSPRPMPAISSATSRTSATVGRSSSASISRRTAVASICSSRAGAGRDTRAAAMAALQRARCCGNTSSARRCTRWESRPRGASRWPPRVSGSGGRRRCPGQCSRAWRPATSAWVRFSMRPPSASPDYSSRCWITPSGGTRRR